MYTIAELDQSDLFVVFLSTKPQLARFAPTVARRGYWGGLLLHYAPYVKTPLDCFGDYPLIPEAITLKDLSDPLYLSLFGRPLYVSFLYPQNHGLTLLVLGGGEGGTIPTEASLKIDRTS